MYSIHCLKKGIATLAVRDRITERYLLFDDENRLCGKENLKTNECIMVPGISAQTTLHRLAFSGIHVVSVQIFEIISHWKDIFPIMDIYLATANEIFAYQHNYGKWMDMGKGGKGERCKG
jgi:hypothetical protein